jgi:hypothetical protein
MPVVVFTYYANNAHSFLRAPDARKLLRHRAEKNTVLDGAIYFAAR